MPVYPDYELPTDKYGIKLYGAMPCGEAINSRTLAITQSTHFILNANTTLIQVSAISKTLYLKWTNDGEDYATANDFDEVIPVDGIVVLGVPLKSDGSRYTGLQVVGSVTGGTFVLIEK